MGELLLVPFAEAFSIGRPSIGIGFSAVCVPYILMAHETTAPVASPKDDGQQRDRAPRRDARVFGEGEAGPSRVLARIGLTLTAGMDDEERSRESAVPFEAAV